MEVTIKNRDFIKYARNFKPVKIGKDNEFTLNYQIQSMEDGEFKLLETVSYKNNVVFFRILESGVYGFSKSEIENPKTFFNYAIRTRDEFYSISKYVAFEISEINNFLIEKEQEILLKEILPTAPKKKNSNKI